MTTQSKHTPAPFIDALLNYQQTDMDGIMVIVSRQAIHETIESHAKLLEALEDALQGHEWYRENYPEDFNECDFEWQEKARAATAKARGES